MALLFISHSSHENEQATRVRDRLVECGWNDIFLDFDPRVGIAGGEKWQEALRRAGESCRAVIALISRRWLASVQCQVEFLLAVQLGKKIFPVLIEQIDWEEIPTTIRAHFQITDIAEPKLGGAKFEGLISGLRRAGLEPHHFEWPPASQPNRLPYRGLEALDEQDAGIFFGRDTAIIRSLDFLRQMRDDQRDRILVVLGASGSGKSSFLRAGLLARLRRDEERFLTCGPVRPANRPVSGREGLVAALALSTGEAEQNIALAIEEGPSAVSRYIQDHKARLVEARASIYGNPTGSPTLVLLVDQLEELFFAGNEETEAFLEIVSGLLAADPRMLVVVTMRSDQFTQLQNAPGLGEFPRRILDLPAVAPSAFREIIVRPGALSNPKVELDAELVDRLLSDLGGDDLLPLLALALQRMARMSAGSGGVTLAQYDALGGMSGAIRAAADNAFTAALWDQQVSLSRSELESLAKSAFIPLLVSVGEVDAPARRRVTAEGKFSPVQRLLLNYFVDQRLLTRNIGRTGEATLEVVHEAVLRQWPLLADWITEARADIIFATALSAAAREWRLREASSGETAAAWLLHQGERLTRATDLTAQEGFAAFLDPATPAYLDACRWAELEASDAARRGRATRWNLIMAAVSVAALVLFLVMGQVALVAQDQANRWVAHTRDVQTSLFEVRVKLLQRERCMSIPDRRRKQSCLVGIDKELRAQIERLRLLTSDNPSSISLVDNLNKAVEKGSNVEALSNIVLTRLEAEEEALSIARNNRVREEVNFGRSLGYLSVVVLLLIATARIAWSFWANFLTRQAINDNQPTRS